jgi:3-isopropylmalate/(R)-2-methylmalate dehydratase small subunit
MAAITLITGRGLPLRGDDLDTDRIMPARFLRAVTFEGLEQHLFEDDRAADPKHPFSDKRYQGATILVVNANFGCGSSREHAPQGLARYGIQAIIGESFSEIFLGNSAVLGIPCFVAERAAVQSLQGDLEQNPELIVEASVETGVISAGTLGLQATLPAGLREAFLTDRWNPTAMLLDDFEQVGCVASRLPYISGF